MMIFRIPAFVVPNLIWLIGLIVLILLAVVAGEKERAVLVR